MSHGPYQPLDGQTTCPPVPAGHAATATSLLRCRTRCAAVERRREGLAQQGPTYKNLNYLGQGKPPFDPDPDNECTQQTQGYSATRARPAMVAANS